MGRSRQPYGGFSLNQAVDQFFTHSQTFSLEKLAAVYSMPETVLDVTWSPVPNHRGMKGRSRAR